MEPGQGNRVWIPGREDLGSWGGRELLGLLRVHVGASFPCPRACGSRGGGSERGAEGRGRQGLILALRPV